MFGATIGPALRNKDVLVIKRLSSHIFNSVLYDSDWGLPFDAMRSRKDTIGIPPDFCKFEAAEQKGWRNLQKYVKALHFAMFVSRNPADDMGFTSHAEASDWVRLSTQKMMDLAEHMVPRMQIFPKHGPPRQYNVFGTRSCTSLACILPKQFAAGMHGSVFSTDKMENMQSIPRIGASQTVRGATQYGKSATLEIMRDQDRRTEMDRKGSKAVERKLRQSEKRYAKRLQRIKPKQLKTVIDDLNMKTLAELTAPHYVSAASSDHRGIAALHETEEEEGEDWNQDVPPTGGENGGAGGDVDDDDNAFAAVETLNDDNMEDWEDGANDVHNPLQAVDPF